MQNVNNPFIEKKASGKDKSRLAGAVVFPMFVFILTLMSINIFKNFGRLLMAPLIGIMWCFGAFVAFYIPSQRKEVINQTLIAVASYCASLLALRELIALTSGVSSQMFVATFGQPMSTAVANTIPGYLQNALYAAAALVPLSYTAMLASRLVKFRRTSGKMRKLEQLRGIRNRR